MFFNQIYAPTPRPEICGIFVAAGLSPSLGAWAFRDISGVRIPFLGQELVANDWWLVDDGLLWIEIRGSWRDGYADTCYVDNLWSTNVNSWYVHGGSGQTCWLNRWTRYHFAFSWLLSTLEAIEPRSKKLNHFIHIDFQRMTQGMLPFTTQGAVQLQLYLRVFITVLKLTKGTTCLKAMLLSATVPQLPLPAEQSTEICRFTLAFDGVCHFVCHFDVWWLMTVKLDEWSGMVNHES